MGRKLTLADMKRKSKDFFFSKGTKKFFKGTRNKAVFDRKSGMNFIRVVHASGRTAWYKFKANGKTDFLSFDQLPKALKKRYGKK